MPKNRKSRLLKRSMRLVAGLFAGCLALAQPLSCQAAKEQNEIELRLEAQRAIPIESNQVSNWPAGPVVSANSAILMEADTGAILYAKNIHVKEAPASTTKILTGLIAAEKSGMDETVVITRASVDDTPRDSSHIAMDAGEEITMEQALNGMLIASANEVAFAIAEHISGTWQEFTELMNERARELGCVDSHFANPNGLPDADHYASAYDMALIARAYFANELLSKISSTTMLHIPPSDTQPDDIIESCKNQLLKGKPYAYDGLVGSKTGYTDSARSCLVSSAERGGMRLICVVMKDESPLQFEDTVSLFNYGFSNFDKVNVSNAETKYNIDNAGFFYSDNEVFGSSTPMLSLNREDCIILPKTAAFEDTVSTISYDTASSDQAALITYTYHDVYIGSVSVDLTTDSKSSYSFDDPEDSDENGGSGKKASSGPRFIFINIARILLWAVGIAAVISAILLLRAFFRNYQVSHPNNRFNWRRKRRKHKSRYPQSSTLQDRRREQIRQAKLRQQQRDRRSRD